MPKRLHVFTDHCVHQDVVLALRALGLKVTTAFESNLADVSDQEIFWCYCG